jgi:hypothetical protein
MFSATPVPALPVMVISARGVVADVALDRHIDRRVHTDRDIVRPGGALDHDVARQARVVQCRIDVTERHGREIEGLRGHRGFHFLHA